MNTNVTQNTNEMSNYKKMAVEMLRNREEGRYYIVNYLTDYCDDPMPYYKSLTEAQFAECERILSECENEDVTLYEHLEENGVPEYLAGDDPAAYTIPSSLELDNVFHKLPIKLAIFSKGLGEAPTILDTHVIIDEEAYASLLEWQLNNRYSSYNDLCHCNSELFKKVNDTIREGFSHCGVAPISTPTFVAEFTGLKDDAYNLCGEPGFDIELAFSSSGTEASHTVMSIHDKVMSLFYEKYNDGCCKDSIKIEDIDAIAVERVLDVESYDEIIDIVKDKYTELEGVKKFASLLEQNGIAFTSNRE